MCSLVQLLVGLSLQGLLISAQQYTAAVFQQAIQKPLDVLGPNPTKQQAVQFMLNTLELYDEVARNASQQVSFVFFDSAVTLKRD